MATTPDAVVSECITPRSFLQEVFHIPIVASATKKVTTTHNSLCTFVPLYERVSSAALSTTFSIARRAKEYTLVKASVNTVEGLGLQVIKSLTNSCPIVKKPTEEVVGEVCTTVSQRVKLGRTLIVTLFVVQSSCRVTEALVATAERACAAFVRKEAEVWTLLVPQALQLKFLSLSQPLNSVERYLRHCRRSVRAWRRSDVGLNISVGLENRKGKQKTGFLTWFWANTQPVAWQCNSPRSLATTRHLNSRAILLQSPNMDLPSEGEERNPGRKSRGTITMSHHDLLHDLEDYCSDDDSDYLPSDSSTDSLEYCSTDSEECEAPIADFNKSVTDREKNIVTNLDGSAEPNPTLIQIIVTDHEAEGLMQQEDSKKCIDENTK